MNAAIAVNAAIGLALEVPPTLAQGFNLGRITKMTCAWKGIKLGAAGA